jgi:hypothetical protein
MDSIVLSILGTIGTMVVGLIGTLLLGSIKEHSRVTKDNTIQLAVLNSKVTQMIEDTKAIPKIQADLNALYQWKKTIDQS